MKPRLLNLAAGVSLLLTIAISALWVRSYARVEAIDRIWHTASERRAWQLESHHSELAFSIMWNPDPGGPMAPKYSYWNYPRNDSVNVLPSVWFPLPPAASRNLSGPLSRDHIGQVAIAYWLLLLLTLVMPLIAFVHHRRRRRRNREANNLCPTCGYDLRASPERCPECGIAVKVVA